MPQLDFATFYSQIFWLFVIFSALYLFITFFFIPQVLGVVRMRAHKIKDILGEAEGLSIAIKECQVQIMHGERGYKQKIRDIKAAAQSRAYALLDKDKAVTAAKLKKMQLDNDKILLRASRDLQGEVDFIVENISEQVALRIKKFYNDGV